jgi:hypothetical protein
MNRDHLLKFSLVFIPLFLGAVGLNRHWLSAADSAEASPQVVLTSSEEAEDRSIEVQGLPTKLRTQISDWKADDPRFGEWLSVYVGKSPEANQPAMFGTFKTTKTGFAFMPRFGLEAGITYSAKLTLPGEKPHWEVFNLPKETPAEPTVITEVYPTGKKLPENLLRLYLHFSAPMSQGRSYRYLHLFDQTGEEVEYPFLDLPQELWTADGKRLTVLLDPGRVKQGLKPREESGPVLVPGVKYTLTIDENWPDAEGNPLAKPFKRTFETTKADVVQPNPADWKITPPKAGTREPLSVEFDEPLDHGMLQRVLSVVDEKSTEIAGRIEVDQEETRWRFTPENPWKQGDYSLRIRTELEDRVGNSIARPFEVDLNEAPLPPVPKILNKRFSIAE